MWLLGATPIVLLVHPSFPARTMQTIVFETGGGSPDDFARFIRSEMAKWGRVITTAKIKVD